MKDIEIEQTFATFNSRDYLKEYYYKAGDPGDENYELLEFFVKAYKGVKDTPLMVEIGGGPTIYQLITAASKVKEIHFSEFLPQNRNEVQKWEDEEENAFQWDSFIDLSLVLEGLENDPESVEKRKKLVREKIKKIIPCDITKSDPLGVKYRGTYDLVSTNFCPESITSDKKAWEESIDNICSLLKPEGVIIMTALKHAHWYYVGSKQFPATYLDEEDIKRVLEKLGFKDFYFHTIEAEVTDENDDNFEGYKGMIFVKAQR